MLTQAGCGANEVTSKHVKSALKTCATVHACGEGATTNVHVSNPLRVKVCEGRRVRLHLNTPSRFEGSPEVRNLRSKNPEESAIEDTHSRIS